MHPRWFYQSDGGAVGLSHGQDWGPPRRLASLMPDARQVVILPSCCCPFSWGTLPTCPHHPSENSSCLLVAPIPSPPRAHPRRRCHSFSPAAVTLLSVAPPPWPRPAPSGHPVGHPPAPFVPAATPLPWRPDAALGVTWPRPLPPPGGNRPPCGGAAG